jgi:hypothetical protein
LVDVRLRMNRVLYYFDRFQHAIEHGLTRFEDVSSPVRWYVRILRPRRWQIDAYASGVKYDGAVKYLEQFDEWR